MSGSSRSGFTWKEVAMFCGGRKSPTQRSYGVNSNARRKHRSQRPDRHKQCAAHFRPGAASRAWRFSLSLVDTLQLLIEVGADWLCRPGRVALARAARALNLPIVVATTAHDSMWGPTIPELVEALPGIEIIDR